MNKANIKLLHGCSQALACHTPWNSQRCARLLAFWRLEWRGLQRAARLTSNAAKPCAFLPTLPFGFKTLPATAKPLGRRAMPSSQPPSPLGRGSCRRRPAMAQVAPAGHAAGKSEMKVRREGDPVISHILAGPGGAGSVRFHSPCGASLSV